MTCPWAFQAEIKSWLPQSSLKWSSDIDIFGETIREARAPPVVCEYLRHFMVSSDFMTCLTGKARASFTLCVSKNQMTFIEIT